MSVGLMASYWETGEKRPSGRVDRFASPGDVAMNHSVPLQDELEIEAAVNVTWVEFVAEELAAPTGLEPAPAA